MRRLLGMCCACLLFGMSAARAQEPAPACEAQVGETYKSLVTDRQIADIPNGTWPQYLASLTSQLRIVTTQYKMQQQSTEQAQALAAQQNEMARQLQQHIATLQQRVRELESQTPPAAAK